MKAFNTYVFVFGCTALLLCGVDAPLWAAIGFATVTASIWMATVALIDFARANLPRPGADPATPTPALPSTHS